jgi:predicted enzyme related to lactoylglutathione lyase
MAKAIGIGGVFFKCTDKVGLGVWYAENLGLEIGEYGGVDFDLSRLPGTAFCVWGPFEQSTGYFDPSDKPFMVNLVVDDLDGALEQVRRGGAEVVGEIEEYEFGRFGWFIDPEGTKIELWQPPESTEVGDST